MGPNALFDKSFLQSISVDQSVWFGQFFSPVTCPLFYLETLADLEKAARAGKTPEEEVGVIALRCPELSGTPCANHRDMLIGDLMGHHVPIFRNQVPRAGGRRIERGGKVGVQFEETLEEKAFRRWQLGEFQAIEREMARQWRQDLASIDLTKTATDLRAIGITAERCATLQDAYDLADGFVTMKEREFDRINLVLAYARVPPHVEAAIRHRFFIANYPTIAAFAPYAAHVLRVQLFFHFGMAARLIGAERASHAIDMAYLYYLPFCNIFVSTDKFHRQCAPYFLRATQRFVWGEDLRLDLARINAHFLELPEDVRDEAIFTFASVPPPLAGSLVRELRALYMGERYDSRPQPDPRSLSPETHEKIAREMKEWQESPSAAPGRPTERLDTVIVPRTVHAKKGSWFQVPKAQRKPSSDGR